MLHFLRLLEKTKIKLMGVSRASLEELLLDYEDYLWQNRLFLRGRTMIKLGNQDGVL